MAALKGLQVPEHSRRRGRELAGEVRPPRPVQEENRCVRRSMMEKKGRAATLNGFLLSEGGASDGCISVHPDVATRDRDGVRQDTSLRGCSPQPCHRKWLKADYFW